MIYKSIFPAQKNLIGMVHMPPLPGTPRFSGSMDEIIESALHDATTLHTAGFDGMILENFNDDPFLPGKGCVERIIAFSTVASELRKKIHIPIGINVQFNDFESELLIAHYFHAEFIRVEVFVDNVMTPAGPCYGCAAELMRMKKSISNCDVLVFADVHVKETVPMFPMSLQESAKTAEKFGANAIIVTGSSTGTQTPLESIRTVKETASVPVIIGSGFTAETANKLLSVADGAIIGTAIKRERISSNPVDMNLAAELVQAVKANA